MKIDSIADIYAENDRIRDKLLGLLDGLIDDQLTQAVPDGRWSIAQIVEHLALVEKGSVSICERLLAKSRNTGMVSTGPISVSDSFMERSVEIASMKVQAPEIVQPNRSQSIDVSVAQMKENRKRLNDLRPLFEAYDGNQLKFRHPFFGEITAVEWLVLIGGHEARHLKQIQTLIESNKNVPAARRA